MIKYTLISGLLALTLGCIAQRSNDEKEVERTILEFVKAGDEHDVTRVDLLLDEHFRIAMNQLFGSNNVTIVNKAIYLSKIKSREWGGDKRAATISDVVIVGKNASVKVVTVGEKTTMTSLYQLVKGADGQWRIINDVPSIG